MSDPTDRSKSHKTGVGMPADAAEVGPVSASDTQTPMQLTRDPKAERLAEALRANLKRRKAADRARRDRIATTGAQDGDT